MFPPGKSGPEICLEIWVFEIFRFPENLYRDHRKLFDLNKDSKDSLHQYIPTYKIISIIPT